MHKNELLGSFYKLLTEIIIKNLKFNSSYIL